MATASTSDQLFSLLERGATTVRLAAGTYELDTQLEITANTTLAAREGELVVLQAQSSSAAQDGQATPSPVATGYALPSHGRVLYVSSGYVQLIGLHIANGEDDTGGGVCIDGGNVEFIRCEIHDNFGGQGGGVHINGGIVHFDGCSIHSNTASRGGGVYIDTAESGGAVYLR